MIVSNNEQHVNKSDCPIVYGPVQSTRDVGRCRWCGQAASSTGLIQQSRKSAYWNLDRLDRPLGERQKPEEAAVLNQRFQSRVNHLTCLTTGRIATAEMQNDVCSLVGYTRVVVPPMRPPSAAGQK